MVVRKINDPIVPASVENFFDSLERTAGAFNLERNQGHILKITHVATGFQVSFPAFLDSLSDAYSSNWTQHPAYGRMDSMATFGSTKRNISVAWNVPAESYEHAQQNLEDVNAS